jgi:PPOX class probable F420-dependent enzyme
VSGELSTGDFLLLRGKNYAHIAAIRPDGSAHVSITWVDARDGRVLVNTSVGRVKDRFLRRDPRVSVTVHAQDNPYMWVGVGGVVEEFITGPEADEHIDFLNRKYHDGEPWTFQPDQVRVLYRIRPERIYRFGYP